MILLRRTEQTAIKVGCIVARYQKLVFV